MTPLDLTTTADETYTRPNGASVTRHGATITTWTGNDTADMNVTYHHDEDTARAVFAETTRDRGLTRPRVGDTVRIGADDNGPVDETVTGVTGHSDYTVTCANGNRYHLTLGDYTIIARPALTAFAPCAVLHPNGVVAMRMVPAHAWVVRVRPVGDWFDVTIAPGIGNPEVEPIRIASSTSHRTAIAAAHAWYSSATVGLPYGRVTYGGYTK